MTTQETLTRTYSAAVPPGVDGVGTGHGWTLLGLALSHTVLGLMVRGGGDRRRVTNLVHICDERRAGNLCRRLSLCLTFEITDRLYIFYNTPKLTLVEAHLTCHFNTSPHLIPSPHPASRTYIAVTVLAFLVLGATVVG